MAEHHLIIGVTIFIITFIMIIIEKIPHTLAALMGAMAMIGLKVISEKKAFGAIDLEVIFLLIGMMIIVHIISETGLFQWIAIKVAQSVRGEPFQVMILLVLVTAVLSALLDNVTTILLIAPVSILLADQLELDPIPFLIAETLASNIGGTATLIGDPPNILIGAAAGLGFNDFLFNTAPIVLINMVVLVGTLWLLFGRKLKVSRDLKAKIMDLDGTRALKNKKLMKVSLILMGFVILGFVGHSMIGLNPSIVAFTGAVVLMIVTKKDPEEMFKVVEWKTLFFFVGLFIVVEGIVEVGVIKIVAHNALKFTDGDLGKTSMLILWLSGVSSGVVDNIPYTATLIPMIRDEMIPMLSKSYSPALVKNALWWALSLGACLGGNATLVGASANVVAASIAGKSGNKISFMKFMKYGVLITLQSMILSSIYLYWRYL